MSISLFRREAIDEQCTRLWGETRLSLPVSFGAVSAFLAAGVMALAAFAATATYARKERGLGFLVPTLGMVKVMPPRSGTIAAVHVTEGELVHQGTPLLTIMVGQSTEGGQNVDGTMLDALRRQRDQLHVQFDLGRRKAIAEAARLEDSTKGLSAELAALEAERKIVLGRVDVARQQIVSVVELVSKGLISQLELKRRQDNHLAHLQGESSLARQIAAKRAELDQARHALQRLPIETAERGSQLEASVADLEARLTEVDGRRAYLLSAPTAGRVSALQAWVGKAAEPVIPQLSIVPDGDVLRAELLVPARAIGFVALGQAVQLRYDAFPYQQFGTAEGTVETVSRTLLKPDELVGPVVLKDPSYRVTIALRRQTIVAYGHDVPLQADMQLAGDIMFDRRSLLAWLMDPLLSAWRKS